MRQVIDRESVGQWLARYETAWRTPGADGLAALFTSDAVYSQSPYEQPVAGLNAIKRMWEEEREGPDAGDRTDLRRRSSRACRPATPEGKGRGETAGGVVPPA